ncbi:protein mono-ADP-ribosyltransferase TIPARP-like [Notamacropus eugenii]|uniref:protein mono-ADP-ribosyltransferase TIPARP-like n=1 Tax=Notamacropus eugenii TaxID=9315 RepID=UPI003B67CE2B
MAGLFEGQKTPPNSPESWAQCSGVISVEDVTRPQGLRVPQLQEFTTELLLENLTLEDISRDPNDGITHRHLDSSTHPFHTDWSTMAERSQEDWMGMTGPTRPSSTVRAVTTHSSSLSVMGPSQGAGRYKEGLEQPAVERIVRPRTASSRVISDSSCTVQRAAATLAHRGLESVAGQAHVFLGAQSQGDLRPFQVPSTPSQGSPRGPSTPSQGSPRGPSTPSRGSPLRLRFASYNSSTQHLWTSSRDSTRLLVRDEMPHQDSPQGTGTKIQLYSEMKSSLRNGSVVNIFSAKESGLLKEGEQPHVCENFLLGTCQRDSACPYYHTLLPFHWQFHHKQCNLWYSIPLGAQMHLEMIYANPNIKAAEILNGNETLYLDMSEKVFMEINDCFDFARRLCCGKDSVLGPSRNFYFLSGQIWILCNQGIQIQNQIMTMYMEQMNLQKSVKIIDRPKYIPLYQQVNLRVWFSDHSRNVSWWGEGPSDAYIGNYPFKSQVISRSKEDKFLVIEMAPSEPAYRYCCQLFHRSIPPGNALVLRIYRYYNPLLWEQYQREKRRLKNLQIPSPLEYQLFYQGYTTFESLARHGLCPKIRSSQGLLGQGLYFSLNAYVTSSKMDPPNGHMMVLAKVLVGEKTIGHPFFCAAPLKANGQEYDSCVDDIDMPTLFALFRKELVYPYFIIFYRRLTDPVHLVF